MDIMEDCQGDVSSASLRASRVEMRKLAMWHLAESQKLQMYSDAVLAALGDRQEKRPLKGAEDGDGIGSTGSRPEGQVMEGNAEELHDSTSAGTCASEESGGPHRESEEGGGVDLCDTPV